MQGQAVYSSLLHAVRKESRRDVNSQPRVFGWGRWDGGHGG